MVTHKSFFPVCCCSFTCIMEQKEKVSCGVYIASLTCIYYLFFSLHLCVQVFNEWTCLPHLQCLHRTMDDESKGSQLNNLHHVSTLIKYIGTKKIACHSLLALYMKHRHRITSHSQRRLAKSILKVVNELKKKRKRTKTPER